MTEDPPLPASARPGRLATLLASLATTDGYNATRLPGVKIMRSSRAILRSQVSYSPSLVIIAQGRKRGYLGERIFTYDANHFLVLSVPLPFECETLASPDGPLLGLSIEVEPTTVAKLLLSMKPPEFANVDPPDEAIRANPLDNTLYDAAVRLMEAIANSDEEAAILGPAIVREMLYRVLCGAGGGPLRLLATPHSHVGRISHTLQRLHADFASPVNMAHLATDAGMSLSTFHEHFKAITGSPPLQYLKAIRLHKARLFMLQQGDTAAAAALKVGYESASQFSREFKRYFGTTPAAEVSQLRANLMQPA
ncbi:AraC-like DNA-binding protein [Haloferula luteola]|uniref:AraC-like DNA-binding protein n=1 Tax=Haloferula luteola TaxID=595692 RepID=A0A840VI31_9BACT|nr:AraC family transcriptional regulator [Haloferula luteola]MBB5353490.1 AraC-like DNA-binding protein [Haloferula luteola]